jgi:hypothetical protein
MPVAVEHGGHVLMDDVGRRGVDAGRRKRDNLGMDFEVIGTIANTEVIAVGRSIRELPRLRRVYGAGRWRKIKGVATVRLDDGLLCKAEVHWYEAHGIGKREMKIKRFLT